MPRSEEAKDAAEGEDSADPPLSAHIYIYMFDF